MIPRIKQVKPLDNYILYVLFDDGKAVLYDVKEDMETVPDYGDLKAVYGLFNQVQLDQSRTCVYWTDDIDLPSDVVYEYGKHLTKAWDPDYTRVTPAEKKALEEADREIAEHETIPHEAINWD